MVGFPLSRESCVAGGCSARLETSRRRARFAEPGRQGQGQAGDCCGGARIVASSRMLARASLTQGLRHGPALRSTNARRRQVHLQARRGGRSAKRTSVMAHRRGVGFHRSDPGESLSCLGAVDTLQCECTACSPLVTCRLVAIGSGVPLAQARMRACHPVSSQSQCRGATAHLLSAQKAIWWH